MTDDELLLAVLIPALWLLLLVVIAVPFELTERGRRVADRIIDRILGGGRDRD